MAISGQSNRARKAGFILALFSMTFGWANTIYAQRNDAIGRAGNMPSVLPQVYGAIGDKWRALGGNKSFLGPPISNEEPLQNGGRIQRFRGGNLVWSPSTGAHAIYGLIYEKWMQLGGAAFGFPITDELPGASGGRYNDFSGGGSIYWKAPTGAHAVYGNIRAKWKAMGGENSFLRYPLTDELPAANGGRMNAFEGGDIYWSSLNGAFAVYGKIREEWIRNGKDSGKCGLPTHDEYGTTDQTTYPVRQFRRSDFTNGNIVWAIKEQYAVTTCGNPSAAQPVTPVTSSSVCSVSVIIVNKSCLNADSTPSTILTPGGTSVTGCGDSSESAKAHAKLSFQQFGSLTDGDTPAPGSCTYSEQIVQGCLCK